MGQDNLLLREKVAQEKRKWVRLTWACNENCLFCLDKGNHSGMMEPLERIYAELHRGRKRRGDSGDSVGR